MKYITINWKLNLLKNEATSVPVLLRYNSIFFIFLFICFDENDITQFDFIFAKYNNILLYLAFFFFFVYFLVFIIFCLRNPTNWRGTQDIDKCLVVYKPPRMSNFLYTLFSWLINFFLFIFFFLFIAIYEWFRQYFGLGSRPSFEIANKINDLLSNNSNKLKFFFPEEEEQSKNDLFPDFVNNSLVPEDKQFVKNISKQLLEKPLVEVFKKFDKSSNLIGFTKNTIKDYSISLDFFLSNWAARISSFSYVFHEEEWLPRPDTISAKEIIQTYLKLSDKNNKVRGYGHHQEISSCLNFGYLSDNIWTVKQTPSVFERFPKISQISMFRENGISLNPPNNLWIIAELYEGLSIDTHINFNDYLFELYQHSNHPNRLCTQLIDFIIMNEIELDAYTSAIDSNLFSPEELEIIFSNIKENFKNVKIAKKLVADYIANKFSLSYLILLENAKISNKLGLKYFGFKDFASPHSFFFNSRFSSQHPFDSFFFNSSKINSFRYEGGLLYGLEIQPEIFKRFPRTTAENDFSNDYISFPLGSRKVHPNFYSCNFLLNESGKNLLRWELFYSAAAYLELDAASFEFEKNSKSFFLLPDSKTFGYTILLSPQTFEYKNLVLKFFYDLLPLNKDRFGNYIYRLKFLENLAEAFSNDREKLMKLASILETTPICFKNSPDFFHKNSVPTVLQTNEPLVYDLPVFSNLSLARAQSIPMLNKNFFVVNRINELNNRQPSSVELDSTFLVKLVKNKYKLWNVTSTPDYFFSGTNFEIKSGIRDYLFNVPLHKQRWFAGQFVYNNPDFFNEERVQDDSELSDKILKSNDVAQRLLSQNQIDTNYVDQSDVGYLENFWESNIFFLSQLRGLSVADYIIDVYKATGTIPEVEFYYFSTKNYTLLNKIITNFDLELNMSSQQGYVVFFNFMNNAFNYFPGFTNQQVISYMTDTVKVNRLRDSFSVNYVDVSNFLTSVNLISGWPSELFKAIQDRDNCIALYKRGKIQPNSFFSTKFSNSYKILENKGFVFNFVYKNQLKTFSSWDPENLNSFWWYFVKNGSKNN